MTIHGNPKRTLALLAALAVCCGVWLALHAGEMEPPGPPGPTLKPLNELEAHVPIYAEMLPLTIGEPGAYYLMEDIVTTGGGITIGASYVTLDLNGYRLSGGTGNGITVTSGSLYVTVKNGTVEGWGQHGIDTDEKGVVVGILAVSNTGNGIQVENKSRVIDCLAHLNGGHGIEATDGSLVRGCQATNNAQNGIRADHSRVIDCVASRNERNGIRVDHYSSVTGCLVSYNDWMQVNGKAGIWITGDGNHVQDNHLAFNNVGIDLDGDDNVVVRNVITECRGTVLDIDPGATGNLAETKTDLSTAGPWSNLVR